MQCETRNIFSGERKLQGTIEAKQNTIMKLLDEMQTIVNRATEKVISHISVTPKLDRHRAISSRRIVLVQQSSSNC